MQTYEQLAIEMCEEVRVAADTNQYYYPDAIVTDEVLKVMAHIPRHLFIPDIDLEMAYTNRALSIGYNQTISQPYIVALMTSLLMPKSKDIILEIGTGSGYQAAILSKLAKMVFTLELIPNLAINAIDRFKELNLNNIICKQQSGINGYPEGAPYAGIIVTAAVNEVPPSLIEQLAIHGRMVIPLESTNGEQNLYVIKKLLDGSYTKNFILPVRFVPFLT